MQLKLKAVWILVVMVVAACGTPRPPSLQWPAKLAATDGIEGDAHTSVSTFISQLNSDASRAILDVGAGGSPIYIKKVTSFEESNVVAESHTDGENVHYAYVGMVNGRGVLGTRIAGRATLMSSQCTIELGSFLLEASAKNLLQPVLWHEIGHCAGLAHVTDAGELMSPVTLPFSRYTEDHLKRFFDALLLRIQEST